mgnify:CR=1 FL=1
MKKNILLRSIGVAVLSLMFAVPAYANPAQSAQADGGNGGLGNGMGARPHVLADNGSVNAKAASRHDVSVYGTGTGNQFRNVNANAGMTTDRQPMDRTHANANDRVRTLDTVPSRGMSWGWLGLLGLLGLFGNRSRNPQRDR